MSEKMDYEPIKTGKDGLPISRIRLVGNLAIKLGIEYGSDIGTLMRESREDLKARISALEDPKRGIRKPDELGPRAKALKGLKTRP